MKIIFKIYIVLLFFSFLQLSCISKSRRYKKTNKHTHHLRSTEKRTNNNEYETISANAFGKLKIYDTARDCDYLNEEEKNVIFELNKVRLKPALYAKLYLEPLLKHFNGKIRNYPPGSRIETKEGIGVVKECIKYLKEHPSVNLLFPSPAISEAAEAHALDQEKTGETGHYGSDGSSPSARMWRHGVGRKHTMSENISYGYSKAYLIVMSLLIDDGVPSRGHRKSIMNKLYYLTGVSIKSHPVYGNMCVIDFTSLN
jgi:uncharacterized protein YkwD